MTSGCPRRPYWNTWIPRTEGNILLLIFMSVWWLVDKLPDPPSSLSSGCCGGPEWAERIAFNSKPIRMHFCCTPRPPISSLGRLSCTDDVTDCCEHCFHGNAYHRFGLHFRELSLHSPTPPPPLTSHTLRPLFATQPSHPSSDENRREVGGGFGGGPHCCGQEERHGQKEKTTLKNNHSTGLVSKGGLLGIL